ncbi:MAG: Atg14 domain-containing protein [Fischerella sp.]|nr:Atg14 domain-containing protein [Fischerella sp.]
MFGLGSIKLYIILAALVIIAGSATGLYLYVTRLQHNLEIQKKNNEILTTAVQQQKATIDAMEKEIQEVQKRNKQINSVAVQRRREIEELRKRFDTNTDGSPRNFAAEAAADPVKMQEKINQASIFAARCLEIASGSPLTEQELKATKQDEINTECPALANPNYKPISK